MDHVLAVQSRDVKMHVVVQLIEYILCAWCCCGSRDRAIKNNGSNIQESRSQLQKESFREHGKRIAEGAKGRILAAMFFGRIPWPSG
jgi:hypothetical protein